MNAFEEIERSKTTLTCHFFLHLVVSCFEEFEKKLTILWSKTKAIEEH